nr:MAG TPA: hypothetical protein [Caudoviricetes sp.]
MINGIFVPIFKLHWCKIGKRKIILTRRDACYFYGNACLKRGI